MKYSEVGNLFIVGSINPCHSGFGMYEYIANDFVETNADNISIGLDMEASEVKDQHIVEYNENILYDDIYNVVERDTYCYELGVDELPDGVEDIRGRIYNEPDIVFATVDKHNDISYFGIEVTKYTWLKDN